jgi:hypothetical protein
VYTPTLYNVAYLDSKLEFLSVFNLLPSLNPLKAELKPICHLLALLGAHHIFHISVLRVKLQPECGLLRSSCCVIVSPASAFEPVDWFSRFFCQLKDAVIRNTLVFMQSVMTVTKWCSAKFWSGYNPSVIYFKTLKVRMVIYLRERCYPV